MRNTVTELGNNHPCVGNVQQAVTAVYALY